MNARSLRTFALYGFESTHDALAAESALREAGIAVVPVPSPKELGELCGIALRVELDDVKRAEDVWRGASMKWNARIDTQDL